MPPAAHVPRLRRGRDVGAGADVLVPVRVEPLAMGGEEPLHRPVHVAAMAGSPVEGDHGDPLLGSGGDRLAGPDVVARAGPGPPGPAPGRPGDMRNEAGGVPAVEDLGRPDLAKARTVGEEAG